MQNKYIFEVGGETDFFSQYADNIISSNEQDDEQTPQEQQAPVQEEESEYIKNLRSYDEEQTKQQPINDLNERFSQLEKHLDEKLSYLQSKQQEFDWFADEDNQDQLMDMYDTRNEKVPYDPNISQSYNRLRPNNLTNNSYKDAIGKGESGNNYFAQNPQPGQTAFGKYQFIRSTRQGVYNQSPTLKAKYPTVETFEQAFKGQLGKQEAIFAQETTMDEYTNQGQSIHKNDPIAKALYHYSPKFAQMYVNGQLDLNKNPAYYGVGKGVNNPTFKSFLKSHNIIK